MSKKKTFQGPGVLDRIDRLEVEMEEITDWIKLLDRQVTSVQGRDVPQLTRSTQSEERKLDNLRMQVGALVERVEKLENRFRFTCRANGLY